MKVPTKSNMYDAWKQILKKAEVDYATSHKLRKTVASTSIGAGIEISVVSEILGRRDPGITMQAYYKPVNQDSDNLRNQISNMYEKTKMG